MANPSQTETTPDQGSGRNEQQSPRPDDEPQAAGPNADNDRPDKLGAEHTNGGARGRNVRNV
jgi:hypothetical protein